VRIPRAPAPSCDTLADLDRLFLDERDFDVDLELRARDVDRPARARESHHDHVEVVATGCDLEELESSAGIRDHPIPDRAPRIDERQLEYEHPWAGPGRRESSSARAGSSQREDRMAEVDRARRLDVAEHPAARGHLVEPASSPHILLRHASMAGVVCVVPLTFRSLERRSV
jgi:hypothetical protein